MCHLKVGYCWMLFFPPTFEKFLNIEMTVFGLEKTFSVVFTCVPFFLNNKIFVREGFKKKLFFSFFYGHSKKKWASFFFFIWRKKNVEWLRRSFSGVRL